MTFLDFINSLKIISRDYSGGIPKREIFSLAKEFQYMAVSEVVKLLKEENYDHRLAAVSILDWKARAKTTTPTEKEAIYLAYIENHKYIDDWGMVDRAAPYVVGGYLYNRDKKVLYDLAKSKHPMERRTAIVGTYYFIRKNDLEHTFNIAEILANDPDEYVQKAVGSWIREAGKKDEAKLKEFLDKFAHSLPRISLRYAIDKLDPEMRKFYLGLAKQSK